MSKWLLCSALLTFGLANIAAGRTPPAVVGTAKHLPVFKEATAFISSGWGRGVSIVGVSLALICGTTGCGTDTDEAPQALTQVVTDDTSNDDMESNVYDVRDYLGNYIAYIGDGDGSIATGYVINYTSPAKKLILESEEKGHWGEEDDGEISLQAVVGVMHQNHALAGEEVSFKRVHGAMPLQWGDDQLPDQLYGRVDVVYIAALLPEGSGEPTAVGVTVHSGDFGARKERVQWHKTVFLPIDRVEFIDVDK